MDEITVMVSGVDSPHAVRTVSRAVADVAGVRVLTVDPASGTVQAAGDVDRRAVCDAIRDAGFEVRVWPAGAPVAGRPPATA